MTILEAAFAVLLELLDCFVTGKDVNSFLKASHTKTTEWSESGWISLPHKKPHMMFSQYHMEQKDELRPC